MSLKFKKEQRWMWVVEGLLPHYPGQEGDHPVREKGVGTLVVHLLCAQALSQASCSPACSLWGGLLLSFAHSPSQMPKPGSFLNTAAAFPGSPHCGWGHRKGCLPSVTPGVGCWLWTGPLASLAGSEQLHQPGSQGHRKARRGAESKHWERGHFKDRSSQSVCSDQWDPCRPHCLHWRFANCGHNLLVWHKTHLVNLNQHFLFLKE